MTAVHNPFARTLSLTVHELRTPVTVVSGYLRMLLKEQGGPLTEKQRKMLEEAERSCGRIGALVSEMSDLGKLESGDVSLAKQDLDVSTVLTSLASNMHEGEDRGVRIELRGVDQPLMVVGDRVRLEAALKSLLHSALRERGEAGAVVVECTVPATSPPTLHIAIGDEEAPNTLAESSPEIQPFDEFRGGLGLSLPVARRIIAAHGGKLEATAGGRPRAGCAVQLPLKA